MSHYFSKLIKQRHDQELKEMQDKSPPPKSCDKCEPSGFMNLIETTERISTYNEEKRMYEYVDTSRFSLYRCTNCNAETYI